MAEIARGLGLTAATVSLALRDHPKISATTRDRVKHAAAAAGYRPDPVLGKLMHHLRNRRRSGFKSMLCALSAPSGPLNGSYAERLLEGARRQAETLGYGMVSERFTAVPEANWILQRRLLHSGIEGLLLLPMPVPLRCDDCLDWERFSVVSANLSVVSPDFDRVGSHWFASVRTAFSALRERGYRRVGMIVNALDDSLRNQQVMAGALCEPLFGDSSLPPFLHLTPRHVLQPAWSTPDFRRLIETRRYDSRHRPLRPLPAGLRDWFNRTSPDALLVDSEAHARLISQTLRLESRGAIGFAVLGRSPDSPFAGIEECPDAIGAAAVELLHQKLLRGERGVPANPVSRMIKGRWALPAGSASLAETPFAPIAAP